MFSSLNQKVGGLLGLMYIVVGGVGFAVTGFTDFAATNTGDSLLFLELNPLHNIAHLLIGAWLLFAARAGQRASATANMAVGATYLALGVVGLFVIDTSTNILSINHPDNFLHIASALALLGVGLSTVPTGKPGAAPEREPKVTKAKREKRPSKQKGAKPTLDDAPTLALTLQSSDDYDGMSKEDLYSRAQKLEISGRSTMSKEELAEAVRNSELTSR